MAEGGFFKKSLKWAFRIAVWGVGFAIGTELITEFLTYGMLHGESPLSQSLAYMSKEFTEPIMNWLNAAIGGEGGLDWFKGILKSIHEFFGITDSFNVAATGTAQELTNGTVKNAVGALEENFVPGMGS